MNPASASNLPSDVAANACGNDTKCHVERIRGQMEGLIQHLRMDSERVSEPQAKAMFETSAEVIEGLTKAFHDYEKRNEGAWNK